MPLVRDRSDCDVFYFACIDVVWRLNCTYIESLLAWSHLVVNCVNKHTFLSIVKQWSSFLHNFDVWIRNWVVFHVINAAFLCKNAIKLSIINYLKPSILTISLFDGVKDWNMRILIKSTLDRLQSDHVIILVTFNCFMRHCAEIMHFKLQIVLNSAVLALIYCSIYDIWTFSVTVSQFCNYCVIYFGLLFKTKFW